MLPKWLSGQERYTVVRVGDREANDRLMNVSNRFPAPIRERRAWYEQHPDYTRGTLRAGAEQEQPIANWKPSQCMDGRLAGAVHLAASLNAGASPAAPAN